MSMYRFSVVYTVVCTVLLHVLFASIKSQRSKEIKRKKVIFQVSIFNIRGLIYIATLNRS